MNTPAHLVLNAVALGRGRWRSAPGPIVLGALLPDLPMLGFYLYQKGFMALPESRIWSEAYFRPDWQLFFDLFNSLPILALVALLAWRSGATRTLALVMSMILHCLADLPLHHDDAHAHFRPLTSWRFESPISYWDARHHGRIFSVLEMVLVLAGSALLVLRGPGRAWRLVGAGTLAAYALFLAFVVVVWL